LVGTGDGAPMRGVCDHDACFDPTFCYFEIAVPVTTCQHCFAPTAYDGEHCSWCEEWIEENET